MSSYENRCNTLRALLLEYVKEDVIVAFSGGIDSSLILHLCCNVAKTTGSMVYAVMFHTILHPTREVEDAQEIAREAGATFRLISIDELTHAGIEENPIDRCYRCKKYLFTRLKEEARDYGVSIILEGTNADDLNVYRPGIRAVKELGILSPLADARLTKQEVRALSAECGLPIFNKPSAPCLATRFPYGTMLSYEEMQKVEQGEQLLRGMGFYNVRLRVHGDVVRIEVDEADMGLVMEHSKEIITCLNALGYLYITLDLEGFRSGSMDTHFI